jgi:allophanate hydrolase
MSKIAISDLAKMKAGYAARYHTPIDVIEEVNRKIAAAGDDHVWIHRLSTKELIRRAAELAALSPEKIAALPLYGIPFAIKDNFDLEGHPTTAGCPNYSYVAKQTAPVVQRLLDAGAMLVGKTNMDQFATGLTGARSPYGSPRNPYGDDLCPGGSSSGSAVAVSAGQVTFALGTDTAGSGRVPAAFNNIVGLKPTRGLLSTTGVVPACRSLDCVAIFATDVQCAERAFNTMIAFDPSDAFSRVFPVGLEAVSIHKVGILRAADREFYGDKEASTIYESGTERLRELKFDCQEIDFTPFREAAEMLYNGPWMAERDVAVGEFVRREPESVVEVTRNAIINSSRFTAADAFKAYYRIKELRAVTNTTWAKVDAIFIPTTPTIYNLTEARKDPAGTTARLSHYTNFANLLDLCAIAVPSGFTPKGFPAGATFIAPAFHDRSLAAACNSYLGE